MSEYKDPRERSLVERRQQEAWESIVATLRQEALARSEIVEQSNEDDITEEDTWLWVWMQDGGSYYLIINATQREREYTVNQFVEEEYDG